MKSLRLLQYKIPSPSQRILSYHRRVYMPAQPPITLSANRCQMFATGKTSVPHELRTAAEPRQNRLYNVHISHIEQISPTIRLLQLTIPPHESDGDRSQENEEPLEEQPFSFLPGQWLDVHIPSISHAGGFSITSTPADARALPSPAISTEESGIEELGNTQTEPGGRPPYVELAVQEAPGNPAGAWLWRPKEEILGKELSIRVGGSFFWPPSGIQVEDIKNVVLIAGGVGINPLISILSHLNNNDPSLPSPRHLTINILYSVRLPKGSTANKPPEEILDQILFLPRLRQIMHAQSHSLRLRISIELFITDLPENSPLMTAPPSDITVHSRRIKRQDLQATVIGEDADVNPKETVCYLCGPPKMTDEFVEVLRGLLGGEKERVLFEKWW